jgi:hypothetical protein
MKKTLRRLTGRCPCPREKEEWYEGECHTVPQEGNTEACESSDSTKYFTEQQIRLRGRTVGDGALLAASKGLFSPSREWMIVDMLIGTALRFPEAANLRCGGAKSSCGQYAVFVTAQCVLSISLCVLSQSFNFLSDASR